MHPFTLTVTEEQVTIYVPDLGYYDSPVRRWLRVCSYPTVVLLARWDDVHDGFQDECAEARATFISLPQIAQAAMVAEWEGDDDAYSAVEAIDQAMRKAAS